MKHTPHCVFCDSTEHHTVEHQLRQVCGRCGYEKQEHEGGKGGLQAGPRRDGCPGFFPTGE